jgi:hypothetical protein
MSDELERIWREVVKALSWYSPGEANKIMKTSVRIASVLAGI